MKTVGFFLLSLTMAVMLSGCDIADKIPLTPKDALRLADTFGAATREEISKDESGITYEVLVESRRKGSWASADLSIRRQLTDLCPDGQRPSSIKRSPELLSDSVAARNVDHAEGTTYRLTYLCPFQPYEEMNFVPGTERREAESQLYDSLSEEGWAEGRHGFAYSLPTSKWLKKYEWINELIGQEVSRRLPHCPEGVIVRRVLIGNYAEGHQPQDAAKDRPEFVLGVLSDCMSDSTTEGTLAQ